MNNILMRALSFLMVIASVLVLWPKKVPDEMELGQVSKKK